MSTIIEETNKKEIKAGDIILKQGDEGSHAFIIESGSVEILIEKENNLIQSIGTRGPGTIIGEMALVDNNPRTATIKAVEDSVLLEITKNDFERRLGNSDPVIQMVTQVILARYRDIITRAQILGTQNNTSTPEELEKGLVEKTNAVANIKLSNELKNALDNDELELHYQPIIDLKTKNIKGFEALIRWKHDKKGYISPEIFIPLAEDNGQILDISRWVVLKACKTLRKVKDAFNDNDFFMSVNFSASDFANADFKSYVNYALNESNIKPHEIHLEITERLLMNNPRSARDTIEACRKDGMLISIDDFGTGYSSLSYLHHFPIDILKIDQSFINNMVNDQSALELVKSIITLSHNMGMKIIAEGIETEEQSQILENLNCDQVQGYLDARPMSEDNLILFIQQQS